MEIVRLMQTGLNQKDFLNLVAQTIYDKNGCNILALDVRGVSTMTDYFLIAEGNVARHVAAIADAVVEAAEKAGAAPLFVEGKEAGDWVALDFGELVVHLFTGELRQHYRLEELWHNGEVVDLHLNVSAANE